MAEVGECRSSSGHDISRFRFFDLKQVSRDSSCDHEDGQFVVALRVSVCVAGGSSAAISRWRHVRPRMFLSKLNRKVQSSGDTHYENACCSCLRCLRRNRGAVLNLRMCLCPSHTTASRATAGASASRGSRHGLSPGKITMGSFLSRRQSRRLLKRWSLLIGKRRKLLTRRRRLRATSSGD